MKPFFLLLFSVLLPAWAPGAAGQLPGAAVEPGVTEALAHERAATLSHVSYRLFFSLPAEKDSAVSGTAEVVFTRTGTADVQLDFQGEPSQFDGRCRVNGREARVSFEQEHIVVPAALLGEGENSLVLDFKAGNKALNRSNDYLYTLFVPDHARSVFPCFDQPDLKARFQLTLVVPEGWTALSNAPVATTAHRPANATAEGGDTLTFAPTEHPLPTYLFSFVAGRFQQAADTRDGRRLSILYRETDPAKTAQLPVVFDEIALSLQWMEDYTGMAYPFEQYACVVLPGYQFGGMEHPGCIQFTDREIFLGPQPTPDEELTRLNLIAHETAHMWFGDLVTMRWFNDVWTKEVFANFMADKIGREQFPDVDHDLVFLRAHYPAALATDRTQGTHPIQQSLPNLNQAGLLYGNIIYHKAPIMMRQLEGVIGEESMRQGLQAYLRHHAYGNATWDDLVVELDQAAPGHDIATFSETWVKEKGLPTITCERLTDGRVIVRQNDPYQRQLHWNQRFELGFVSEDARQASGFRTDVAEAALAGETLTLPMPRTPGNSKSQPLVVPNLDGRGYGRFACNEATRLYLGYTCQTEPSPARREAALITLFENYTLRNLTASALFGTLLTYLAQEENPLVAATLCSYLARTLADMPPHERSMAEHSLYSHATAHALPSVRQQLMRLLGSSATSESIVEHLYAIWQNQQDTLLNERDYMSMAYHLAIMRPADWASIIGTQRSRLTTPDRQREFDYIARGCNPDPVVQDSLFRRLLEPEERRVEPWARSLLALLNHPTREPFSNHYLTPALDALPEIQQTSDIFFPGYWLSALMAGHRSDEARRLVKTWIERHPELPLPLMNKLKENAYWLTR